MRQIVGNSGGPGDRPSPGPPAARRRRMTIALWLALGIGALAGVLAEGSAAVPVSPAASEPGSMPVAEPASAAGDRPPIYVMVYSWTAAGDRITRAQQRLIADCMAARGFRYEPAAPATAEQVAADQPKPFGLESLEPPDPGPALSETPREDGEDYGRALYGSPEHRVRARGARLSVSGPATGCLAAAEDRLLGDGRQRWMQLRILLLEAEEEARTRLDEDPRFQAVTERWRQCMRQLGFDERDPRRLAEDLPAGADLGEQPLARADLDCKARTGYLSTGYARLTETQRGRLGEDPSLTDDWNDLLARQDAIARAVLG